MWTANDPSEAHRVTDGDGDVVETEGCGVDECLVNIHDNEYDVPLGLMVDLQKSLFKLTTRVSYVRTSPSPLQPPALQV
jgi:hypothetical protein